jgi:demethylmenaquinone methyltransferase/2-methoxy-6-polyprenyl-1,4-benzoquinol methylase
MTFGQDKAWRRKAVDMVNLPHYGRALDSACGTAELAIELAKKTDAVLALDFCQEMMSQGKAKATKMGLERKINFILGEAEELPFASDSFDCVVTGFALRNMTSIPRSLSEMHRVLHRGGCLVCLETTLPSSRLIRAFYKAYIFNLIPLLARLVSSDKNAYTYLPNSIAMFLKPEELKAIMEQIGLRQVRYKLLNLGTIAIHTGIK